MSSTQQNPLPGSGEQTSRWYQQPWAWFVIALPLASVIASSVLIYIAVTNQDDLVRDDWYKAGRAINQDLHADQEAQRLELSAQLLLDPAALTIRAEILSPQAGAVTALPARLQLILAHNTLATEDMITLLERTGDGLWQGKLPRLPLGKRRIALEPMAAESGAVAWRLRADDVIFQGVPVALRPGF
ncbi:MAG: FixH family protein [Pseudomonadota bacterium]